MRNGIIAEFDAPEPLLEAVRSLRQRGYRMEAYGPYMVPELDDALGIRRTRIPIAVAVAAVSGAAIAYVVIWWCNAHDFPINVGGRPSNSIPADIPIMFETAVLFSALTAFITLLVTTRMLRLHDPTSELDGFERTSLDRFWLCLEPLEPSNPAHLSHVGEELTSLGAVEVRVVDNHTVGEAS